MVRLWLAGVEEGGPAHVRRALLDREGELAGRVRDGGVQDGGAGHVPEGRGDPVQRGGGRRERQVPELLQAIRVHLHTNTLHTAQGTRCSCNHLQYTRTVVVHRDCRFVLVRVL